MGLEFATAATHNAYYFHKFDNVFAHPEVLCRELAWIMQQEWV